MAMNAAIPAPQPLFWYASWQAAMARRAASASGSTCTSGGSCATSVATASGYAATRASAVTAPPLLANMSTGPVPRASMMSRTSRAWTSGTSSPRPSLRTLRPSPRGSYVTTVRSGKYEASVAKPSAHMGWPIMNNGRCPASAAVGVRMS